MRRPGFGDFRKRDTADTWDEVQGEIMDEKLIRSQEPPTVKELKFAKLINKGEDPMHAVRMVSTVGSNKLSGARKAVEKKANEMLKICQDKMLLDISSMAPKGLKKLEQLLEAQHVSVDKFGDEHTQPDNKVQLGAATTLVKLAMPDEKNRGSASLLGQVINIINE